MYRAWVVLGCVIGLGCAALMDGQPTQGLEHGISGRFHVLIGPVSRVIEACRGITNSPYEARGCYLKAGNTHWIWVSEDTELANTLAHEIRHSHEGEWHD